MKTRRRAASGLAATTALAMVVTAACSSGAGKSHGQATIQVSASPNGEASKTGPQVLADASHVLATVPVVHMSGSALFETGSLAVKAEAEIQADGGTGSMQSPKGTVQLLSVGGTVYLKGDLSTFFGELGFSKSQLVSWAGHWARFPPTRPTPTSCSTSKASRRA